MNTEIMQVKCKDRTGDHKYSIRMLQEFGKNWGYLTNDKIAQLWAEVRKFDVLFSDYTRGKAEPFLDALFNPGSVWLEIFRLTDQRPIGAAYITNVIPHYDAKGHFTLWDKVGSGREPIFWDIMAWLMVRYDLHRITVEIPPYQSGVIRFTKKMGFRPEGEKREAVLHKGKWMPLLIFGLLRSELEEIIYERYAAGEGSIRNPDRDQERGGSAW